MLPIMDLLTAAVDFLVTYWVVIVLCEVTLAAALFFAARDRSPVEEHWYRPSRTPDHGE